MTRKILLLLACAISSLALATPPTPTVPTSQYLRNDAYSTQKDLNFFVATTGNDRNACTSAGTPCLTYQAAIDKVPPNVRHQATVTGACGSYAGFVVSGFNVAPGRGGLATGLHVRGTLQTATGLTGGTATGTLTAFANASGATGLVFTDSTQAWTVNELEGRWIWISSGTGSDPDAIYPIVSNTATAITGVPELITAAAGSGYTILEQCTNLTSVVATEAAHTTSAEANFFQSVVKVSGNDGDGTSVGGIVISRFNFAPSSSARGITVVGSPLKAKYIKTTSNITGGIVGFTGARIYVNRVSMHVSTQGHIACSGTGGACTSLNVFNSYFKAGNAAVTAGNTATSIGGSTFKSQTTASIRIQNGGLPSVSIVSVRIDGSAIGIQNVPNASIAGMSAIAVNFVDISNSTGTAISLGSPFVHAIVSGATGTSNLVGISLVRGASLGISAASTLTGTTEVSVDGTSTTLATMRALSPKAYPATASPYGTRLYEQ